mmetsp:Transcript_1315/g.2738  ORF Transcript_1315/g.2738 Transcript_1315/m.2738 type:complete len:506 (-) Transcript_1315:448-1965(-)
MGGSQSTVSVTEEFLPTQPPLETNATLKGFTLEGNFAASGQRMYKSFRVCYKTTAAHAPHNNSNTNAAPNNNKNTNSTNETTAASSAASGADTVVAVLKVAYLQGYDAEPRLVQPLAQELQQLRQLLLAKNNNDGDDKSTSSHIWPSVTAWFGPSSFKGITSIHPAVWIRPHVYTTLGDRLINRPWLDGTEKLFLILQLLTAVHQLHEAGLVHGNLTTHNIGYTSTGWLVLLDVMPESFRPTLLPHDDPTEYLYCFSKKYCYLAPERFDNHNNKNKNNNNLPTRLPKSGSNDSLGAPGPNARLTPAMDIFSLGCCLVELVLNGESCFDLGQLLDYRKSGSSSSNSNTQTHIMSTQSFWDAAQKIISVTEKHPFLVAMVDGTLDIECFQYYVIQDALYLDDFADCLHRLGDAPGIPEAEAKRLHEFGTGAQEAEKALHNSFCQQWNIPMSKTTPQMPHTCLYTSFMSRIVATRPHAEGLAALLPCFWVYMHVGKCMLKLREELGDS